MALKIKLARGGATHHPVYRIVVAEARGRRDGRFVEVLGTYSPKAKKEQLQIKLDRADYWISVGAKPTDTTRALIKKARKVEVEEGVAKVIAETV
ncbi:MAG: 30S ribosomal protein S16 [Opitutales bacterium]|nr:30S ribosomal protein S16 [Opitutales bacterium]MCH8541822.1 30S ribosomal protein S16 [Opitutales bacterium]